ncbi:hypothetical protein [Actinopolymorpha alba]|uniref:hypothetical protein n=1 Tax=Actinopolymorpha alba TaxID=533267 RepID=UPI000365CFE5|nr:hypothetical protein [Actinopolymorpha alba]
MFIQVIQGHVDNPNALYTAVDRWMRDLASGAPGWLGATCGVGSDGTAIMLARFESKQAAVANRERPERTAWWRETEKLYTGDVKLYECSEVMTLMAGGSDQAGFVQIIQGRIADPIQARALLAESEDVLRNERPDVIGGLLAVHDEDPSRFTQAVYFTNEEAARAGERKGPSAEVRNLLEREKALFTDLRYIDVRQPRLLSPG